MFILITARRYTAIFQDYERDIEFIQQFAISCSINIKNSQMTNKNANNSTTKHALSIA